MASRRVCARFATRVSVRPRVRGVRVLLALALLVAIPQLGLAGAAQPPTLELALCSHEPLVDEARLRRNWMVEALDGSVPEGMRFVVSRSCDRIVAELRAFAGSELVAETSVDLGALDASARPRAVAISLVELASRRADEPTTEPVEPVSIADSLEDVQVRDEPAEVPARVVRALPASERAQHLRPPPRLPALAYGLDAGFRGYSMVRTPLVGGAAFLRWKRLRMGLGAWGFRRSTSAGDIGYALVPVHLGLGIWSRAWRRLTLALAVRGELGLAWARGRPTRDDVLGRSVFRPYGAGVLDFELGVRVGKHRLGLWVELGGAGGLEAAVDRDTRVSLEGFLLGFGLRAEFGSRGA